MAEDPRKKFRRSYTFGGDTGLTQDELAARRKIVNALANSSMVTPKNVGEGIHSVAKALSMRMAMNKLREDQLGLNRQNEAHWAADLAAFDAANPKKPAANPYGGMYADVGDLLGEIRGSNPGGGQPAPAPTGFGNPYNPFMFGV